VNALLARAPGTCTLIQTISRSWNPALNEAIAMLANQHAGSAYNNANATGARSTASRRHMVSSPKHAACGPCNNTVAFLTVLSAVRFFLQVMIFVPQADTTH
jgi:hypothetical protein